MALWTLVELVENGAVTVDDVASAWRSTHVGFGWGKARILVDVRFDGYSGSAKAHVIRDDFALPDDLLGRLAIWLYRFASPDMHAAGSDLGGATCDIEALVKELFYRAEAEVVLRKLKAGIVPVKEIKWTSRRRIARAFDAM